MVEEADVEDAVVAEEEAVVEEVRLRLQECILGVRAEVKSRDGLPRAHRLILGDLSQVELA